MHRFALTLLFGTLATALAAVAVWSALEGGRAWIVALAAAALAAWMGDLAVRSRPRRKR